MDEVILKLVVDIGGVVPCMASIYIKLLRGSRSGEVLLHLRYEHCPISSHAGVVPVSHAVLGGYIPNVILRRRLASTF